MSYKYLLVDLDHTLLDFDAAEEIALTQLLEEAGVEDVQAYKDYYIPMNQGLWADLTQKNISKSELINTRFARLFAHFGQVVDGSYFAERYQHFLSQQGQTFTGAKVLLDNLKARGYRLFAATNGVTFIQKGRLLASEIGSDFEKVFISDEMGAQKPDKKFYDLIGEAVPGFEKEDALMIGDSLLADIQGGNNAGIDTVWFNPHHAENTSQARPSYVVADYDELMALLP
ncbi:YjjG family noncanonical pyrimidine nucleotidase [Streptococcus gallinaceus]|uniref:Hydrolase of the HAD superfamily n=1 Tax=Streptococcus gallinaceus TaxID=165758 RepID=A0ABV2JKX4_9STRE